MSSFFNRCVYSWIARTNLIALFQINEIVHLYTVDFSPLIKWNERNFREAFHVSPITHTTDNSNRKSDLIGELSWLVKELEQCTHYLNYIWYKKNDRDNNCKDDDEHRFLTEKNYVI